LRCAIELHGGVFVVGSLVWGVAVDHFRPGRFDLIDAGLCLFGAAIIVGATRYSLAIPKPAYHNLTDGDEEQPDRSSHARRSRTE
jgi:hypothetical protein